MGISRFIVKPLSKAINQSITGSEEFDPLTLFASGEEGAWYDPSDLTTLYQDSNGTIPVTTDGDPVGLMLDKHSPLGEELADPNAVYVKDDDSSEIVIASGLSLTAGNRYIVSFRKFNHTAGDPRIEFAGTQYLGVIPDVGVDRTVTLALVADVGSTLKLVGIAARISITEVSIKEAPGNHATQPTSSLKPIYRTDGTLHWIEFDGFDDWLAIPIAFMGSASDSNTTIAASKSTGGGIYLLGCTSDQGIMMLNGPRGYRGTVYTSGLHQAGASTGLFVSGSTVVASSKFDRAAGSVDIQLSTGYSDVTTFAPSDKLIPASSALGIRGTQVINLFQGSFYGIVTNNTAMSEADRASAEAYLATKSGATL